MTRTLRAELLKLGTGPIVLLPLVAVVPSVLIAVDVSNAVGPDGALLSATDLARIVNAPHVVLTFLALIAGVLFTTGEWRHHTIVDAVLRNPRRGQLVAAKLVAAAIGGLVLGAAGGGAATVTGWRLIAESGGTPQLTGDYGRVAAAALLSGALYAAFGAALGLLLRSQAAALVVALTWRTGLESLLAVKLGLRSAVDWLPHAVGMTLESAAHGPTRLGLAAAAALFLAYVGALGTAATLRTVRRDVP